MITQNRLKEILYYEPYSGLFYWRASRGSIRAGDTAGRVNSIGYVQIGIERRLFLAHRLAWLYMLGEFPLEIDHINGNRQDNSWRNLRAATKTLNRQNQRRAHKDSATGMIGVSKSRYGRYVAQIRVGQSSKYLGTYDTPQEAHAVYVAAKRKIHEGCTI